MEIDMAEGPGFEADLEVLIVEDDERLAQLYRLKLEVDGYRVRVARDRQQALWLLGAQVPDLIFLDVGLPNLHGWEILDRVRSDARTSAVPVVILSEDCEEGLRSEGLELAAHDHLLRVCRDDSGNVIIGPWAPGAASPA
jgi:DNA-binding response OmpR family regulator